MKKTKGIRKGDKPVVVKPVWWRQVALTLFFSYVDFSLLLLIMSGRLSVGFARLFLGFFPAQSADQLVEWSRLRINEDGYDLRTWFKRQQFRHEKLISFPVKLISIDN